MANPGRKKKNTPDKLSNIDIALAPTLQAAKSFAESVIEEEQKHKDLQHEQLHKQASAANDYDFHPKPEFNITHETSKEIDGLIGTFAKPAQQ